VDEILRYGDQLSDALAEAHRLGVVHRDLKPANIMLTRGVKILDFGVSRIATDPGVTEADAVIGTPAWMAPEQLQGKVADARSDLFSLGLVLYAMTSGTPPFPGSSLASMLNCAPVNVPPLPRVPAGLGKLILRLLEKEPAGRPQTAVEVRESLRKWERGARSAPTVERRPCGRPYESLVGCRAQPLLLCSYPKGLSGTLRSRS
jgi:serine/threonine protein kinase